MGLNRVFYPDYVLDENNDLLLMAGIDQSSGVCRILDKDFKTVNTFAANSNCSLKTTIVDPVSMSSSKIVMWIDSDLYSVTPSELLNPSFTLPTAAYTADILDRIDITPGFYNNTHSLFTVNYKSIYKIDHTNNAVTELYNPSTLPEGYQLKSLEVLGNFAYLAYSTNSHGYHLIQLALDGSSSNVLMTGSERLSMVLMDGAIAFDSKNTTTDTYNVEIYNINGNKAASYDTSTATYTVDINSGIRTAIIFKGIEVNANGDIASPEVIMLDPMTGAESTTFGFITSDVAIGYPILIDDNKAIVKTFKSGLRGSIYQMDLTSNRLDRVSVPAGIDMYPAL